MLQAETTPAPQEPNQSTASQCCSAERRSTCRLLSSLEQTSWLPWKASRRAASSAAAPLPTTVPCAAKRSGSEGRMVWQPPNLSMLEALLGTGWSHLVERHWQQSTDVLQVFCMWSPMNPLEGFLIMRIYRTGIWFVKVGFVVHSSGSVQHNLHGLPDCANVNCLAPWRQGSKFT